MFESPKSRREFLAALQAGRISAQVLQKAMGETAAFADAKVTDLAWSFGNPNEEYKKFAFAVLGVITEEDKADRLFNLYQRERRPEAEKDLARALAACGSQAVLSQLSKMVNNKDVNTRRKALTMFLGQEGWFKHRNMVMTLMEDPKAEISETILRQVVKTAPKAYAGQLRHLSGHAKPEIRALCLQALIGMNRIDNADIFIRRMPREEGELRKALYGAVVAFIKADTKAMTEKIVGALGEAAPEVRQGAMSLLVKMPDQPGTFKQMLTFCGSVSAMMRDQVFSEMAKQADGFADLAINLFKTEKDPALRLQVLHLAKFLKHPKLAPIFLHEMKNPDWMVRYTAMQVLGEMKAAQALSPLVEQMSNPESAMGAIEALDKYRDMRLAKPFLARLPKAPESEQLALLKALENLGDARLLQPMHQFLDSPAPKGKAKKVAAETLIRMCEATNTAVPPRIKEIHDQLAEKTIEDLPDLGLKLV
ncbi:MAG: HEAT repeat domain-containing protein [Acidobacteriota bacterium]|nr:HEAT repeat domain-containing protein [Acidobacteriota bacterium]